MGTETSSVPVTVADALPYLRTGRLARGEDLTNNRPARHLIARRRAYFRQNTAAVLRGRLTGRPDEQHRALRRRITGARAGAKELWELVAHRPIWRVLQSVRADGGALELDQLVIGPGGVYTIHTVYRPTLPVTADAAAYEARRTQEILGRATKVPITVRPVIVFVRADQPRVEGPRDGVEVLTDNELVPWLESRRAMLTERELEIVHLAARDRRTWPG
ncbi:hypothetical protein C8K30_11432 [Promicromonospora sp. AC04]|uniref:hypothetical protein n=1 Tax=Promicromonospora sp. AC04 TaxID=2135723 RepID=UPI000D3808E7|nr:hypothetical protein [Promicromonospora sp. AC04]PUB21489.1 hypothetical protein C8K30_11432 [Promicromonospora sp. AC04]